MSFVHLHLHSQYSMLEATCKVQDIVETSVEMGMPAVALTDNGNMFGAIEFYFACQEVGIQPIIGCDFYLAPGKLDEKGENRELAQKPNSKLVLLAMNFSGYQNLCKLSSIGYQRGFYYKPRIDRQVLRAHSDHLICLSGGFQGEIPLIFQTLGESAALERIREYRDVFADRFYLEINRTGLGFWKEVNSFLIQAARDLGIPLVATNEVYYRRQSDQIAQEVLICIGSNKSLHDENRFRLGSDQFYFKSPQQMEELFKDLPEALENTLQIANRCHVEFHLKDDQGKPLYHLPTYPTRQGRDLSTEIREMSLEGLEKRFQEAQSRGEEISKDLRQKYLERLHYELGVIEEMGFNGYFLIVQDFINWAKENDMPVGPGRGSGAGSLVAYCLGIIDIDPLPYHLIFERFLNPERVSMPDFDIDFCQERRGEVIDYVTQKYGEESVAQIITYGKLQARAAIRDVGRVLGMSYSEVDAVAKLVPDKLGIQLAEALEMEPRIREQMEVNPQVKNLLDLAQKIEGLVRHAGVHAAGVIIADGKLVEHAPLYRGAETENVIQYDMKSSEKIGLIKFDFLGLKTLTHIQDCLRLIEKNKNKKMSTRDISLSDPGIYELMGRGDTFGVFQFESEGITDTLKKVKPNCFEDIVAVNALYRPGPMDMIPEYIQRKHGEKEVQYLFDELEPILQETHGIIVYQEQVQRIAAEIANYSLGEADLLRRAMGKKIPEEMAKQKNRFLKGAQENQYDMKKAGELFELMAEFAKYGFNKSHAAAYCVIAAQTAWLKKYYPVEFYAALLSTEMSDTDKVVKYIKKARQSRIQINPPHINHSEYKFSVQGDSIFFSLGAIKGVGQSAVEAILKARQTMENHRFESLEDFFNSVDLRKINKKVVECLIKSGALDNFGFHRSQLQEGYPSYLEAAEIRQKDQEVGQASLFDMMDEGEKKAIKVQAPPTLPWKRSLRLSHEKEVLGFYLSDHPLRGLNHIFRNWTNCTVDQLKDRENKNQVTLAGLIGSYKEFVTKKGDRMAFASVEDLTGTVELVVFPNVFSSCESALTAELPVLVKGVLEKNEGAAKIIAEKIIILEGLIEKVEKVIVKLEPGMEKKITGLLDILKKHPGPTKLEFQVDLPDMKKQVALEVVEPEGITASGEVFDGIQTVLGKENVIEIRP